MDQQNLLEAMMTETRDWQEMKDMSIRLLEQQTGEGLAGWNRRIQEVAPKDEKELRTWLSTQGVTGYAQMLLVMERFGYPDYFLASAQELIDAQYADRIHLRPIFDKIVQAARGFEGAVIQARKTYVSLMTPRRTFARVQATTRNRVDLCLRLEDQEPGGRLKPSKIHETMKLQIGLTTPEEVDSEVLGWFRRAYEQNR
jgi:hypothetical protein